MSGPDTPHGPDDRALDDFLAGRGALRDAYRAASQAQPTAALDAAILAQAREAVTAAPLRRRVPRWQAPFASAAVIVLAFGVWLQWLHEGGRMATTEATSSVSTTMAVADRAAAEPAAAPAPESPAPRATLAREAEPSRAKAESPVRRKGLPLPVPKAEVAAAPPPAIPQENAPERAEARADQASLPSSAPAPAAVASVPAQMADAAPPAPSAMASMAAGSASAEGYLAHTPAPSAFAARKSLNAEAREAGPDVLETLCTAPQRLAALPRGDDGHLLAALQWRGLPVVAVDAAAGWIEFDPGVTAEAIRRQWGREPAGHPCTADDAPLQTPMPPAGWRLGCDCARLNRDQNR